MKATHGGFRFIKGELVQRIEYTPFGKERFVLNSALEELPKYTGQTDDIETDLYYYGSRYYDPVLGRFIQPDSIIPDAYSSQALNGYSYVLGNPLRYVDPAGYAAEIPWDDQAAIDNDTSLDSSTGTSGGRPAQLPPDDQAAMQPSGETEGGTVVGKVGDENETKIEAKAGVDVSRLRPEITDRYQDIIDVFKQNSAPDPIITDTYQSDKHMAGSRHYTNEGG